MFRRAIPLLVSTLVLVGLQLPRASGQSSLEAELLALINDGRGSDLLDHSGLRFMAEVHSKEMAREGDLNHDGAEGRINDAPPVPDESNGPPDDGFTGTWCENVAFVRSSPPEEVARRVYEGWTSSSSHSRCMNDQRMNAAGVGIYFDGDRTYWATLESVVDQTPPGSAARADPTQEPTPTATPTPTPTLAPTPAPTAAPTATPTPDQNFLFFTPAPQQTTLAAPAPTSVVRVSSSRALDGPVAPSTERRTFGWAELGATLALLALIAELLRRLSRHRELPDA